MNTEKMRDQFSSPPPQISDLDDAPFGLCRADGSASNNPDSFWVTVLTTGAGGYKQQFIFPWSGMSNHPVRWRKQDNGNWGAWEIFQINEGTFVGTTAELKATSRVNFDFFDTTKWFIGHRVNTSRGYVEFYTKFNGSTGNSEVYVRKYLDSVYYGDW